MADGARTAVVIGDPVEHSLSPAIHNAAFAALGLDWHYFAMTVPVGEVAPALALMRAGGVEGMSVTMPHKASVAGLVDSCSPVAARLGALNCVVRLDGQLVGHNTDGAGFIDALRVDQQFDPAGRRAVVFGAGGAARAVILALAEAGALEVVVMNRTMGRAEEAAALAGDAGRAGGADLGGADLVVNATSVGMGDGRLPFDPAAIHTGQLVVDLIYSPAVTPLLAAATARGATAVNGLGLLVHQAAHAFERWTGRVPPIAVMAAAATAELRRRAG